MHRLPCLAAALAFACNRAPPPPPSIQQHVELRAVTSCPAVEKSIQDAAVVEMRQTLEDSIRWRMAWGNTVPLDAGGPARTAPASYTTTNVQTKGVDEPDFVKNDGTRIFTLSGQKLLAAKSWPASD